MALVEDEWVVIPRVQTRDIEEPQVKIYVQRSIGKRQVDEDKSFLPYTKICCVGVTGSRGCYCDRTLPSNSHDINLHPAWRYLRQ